MYGIDRTCPFILTCCTLLLLLLLLLLYVHSFVPREPWDCLEI